MKKQKRISTLVGIIIIIVIAVILFGGIFAYQYFATKTNNPPQVQNIQNNTNQTAGWKIYTNNEYGFEMKYPNGFYAQGHEPKMLTGDCNYSVFPDKCPNIYNIVAEDFPFVSSSEEWDSDFSNADTNKTPNPYEMSKLTINNIPYCLYKVSDAAMNQQYGYYYYTTVKNQKCLVVILNTHTTNCEVYLPLEEGNIEQAKNYNDCLVNNKNQPIILNEIINTFKFNK